ncbi:MAG: extracellular solute-binding protein [Clostridia bacterium]|nr:extracellular solute-binding protein [Clostridia bacterium]
MKKIVPVLLILSLIASMFFCTASAETAESPDASLLIKEGDKAQFSVVIPSDGKYTATVEYYVNEIHGSFIECGFSVDGAQNEDTQTYQLGVTFTSEESSFDDDGNELTPEWEMDEKWYSDILSFETAFYRETAVFELKAGSHTAEISMINGSAYIKNVTFIPFEQTVSYDEYLKNFKSDVSNSKTAPIAVQAEDISFATSKVILPFCDSSSAKVTPIADRLQVINSIGGSSWNLIGQKAVWEFDVKEDGWYSLVIRYRQDYTDGRATIRQLEIDGKTPFKECEAVAFPYKTQWTDLTVSTEDTTYRFYLEKGKHTVSLTPAIGEMGELLEGVQNLLTNLNSIYRKIIMITSSTPDTYRDYRLDEKIPDTLEEINKCEKELKSLIEQMPDGTNCAILKRTAEQLEDMYKYTDTVAGELAKFQSNLSSIGTWINDQKTQPLALDEIALYPSDKEYENDTAGFFKSLVHSVKRFIYSFAEDYKFSKEKKSIEVWVTTGRDQMQIIRRLANETFTANTGIYADLRIIATAALLPAVVAGIGPDVALGEANTTPVNFASRGAIYDLNKFGDTSEITSRFTDAALVPLRYEGGLYALPETLNFNMMFYRTDIFEEYGWTVPETWDDVRNLIFDLSKNNMQFGFTSGFTTYCMLLAQKGGTVYSEDGSYSTLSELPAIEAFEEYTQLYSEYKIPVSFNFANRFRSGEMPIAITGYTAYNTLEVFAPEIKGLWDIALVPGTEGENGSINHASTADGVCAFILNDTKKADKSWEFLKWWTSADVQAKYGNLVEEKLGASARYAPANIESLAEIPWSTAFYKEISNQLQNVVGIPEVPGGYFTPRNFNNAFRATVYDAQDARETLLQYVEIINDEITRKRKEFGLSVAE